MQRSDDYKPVRSGSPVTVIAVAGDWACSADVRATNGAAEVVKLYDFELDGVPVYADRPHDDLDEAREALEEAAVEAYYEATEPPEPDDDWKRREEMNRE